MKTLLLLSLMTLAAHAAEPISNLWPRVYIEPSDSQDTYPAFMALGFQQKHTPVTVVYEREGAFVLSTVVRRQDTKGTQAVLSCVFAYCLGAFGQMQVLATLKNPAGQVVWTGISGALNKNGDLDSARRLAKDLGKWLKKGGRG